MSSPQSRSIQEDQGATADSWHVLRAPATEEVLEEAWREATETETDFGEVETEKNREKTEKNHEEFSESRRIRKNGQNGEMFKHEVSQPQLLLYQAEKVLESKACETIEAVGRLLFRSLPDMLQFAGKNEIA
jgi:hypothetical protein